MQKCISFGRGSIKLILGLLTYELGPLVLGLANYLNKPTKEISNYEKQKKREREREIYLMWLPWEDEQGGPVTTHIILGVLTEV